MKEGYTGLDFTRDVYKGWKIPTVDHAPKIDVVREKGEIQRKEPKVERK